MILPHSLVKLMSSFAMRRNAWIWHWNVMVIGIVRILRMRMIVQKLIRQVKPKKWVVFPCHCWFIDALCGVGIIFCPLLAWLNEIECIIELIFIFFFFLFLDWYWSFASLRVKFSSSTPNYHTKQNTPLPLGMQIQDTIKHPKKFLEIKHDLHLLIGSSIVVLFQFSVSQFSITI